MILEIPRAYQYRPATRHRHAVIREEQILHNWIADRCARGCWLRSVPGQLRRLQELADMRPPVLFAGGDLSRGFMAG